MDEKDMLIEILRRIPALEERGNRTLLLRHLPQQPASHIPRSEAYGSDIAGIVSHVAGWGLITDQNKTALEIIRDAAIPFVKGMQIEGELRALDLSAPSNPPPIIVPPQPLPTPQIMNPSQPLLESSAPTPTPAEIPPSISGLIAHLTAAQGAVDRAHTLFSDPYILPKHCTQAMEELRSAVQQMKDLAVLAQQLEPSIAALRGVGTSLSVAYDAIDGQVASLHRRIGQFREKALKPNIYTENERQGIQQAIEALQRRIQEARDRVPFQVH